MSPLLLSEIDHVATRELGREAVLSAVDDIRRKVFVAQPHHPLGELTTERLRAGRRWCAPLLQGDRGRPRLLPGDSRKPNRRESRITEELATIAFRKLSGHDRRILPCMTSLWTHGLQGRGFVRSGVAIGA